MNLATVHTYLLYFLIGFSLFTFIASLKYTSRYGRFKRKKEKYEMDSLAGWLIMEFPCLVAALLTFTLAGGNNDALVPLVFMCIWQGHYIYRSIIFPLRMSDRGKKMPLGAIASGFSFNALNGFLNGYAFSHTPHLANSDWLSSPYFIIGIVLMIIGLSINIYSDTVLRNLRAPGETGYKIPYGGAYRWISVPNYFGEIIEWLGLAIASCTPAAAVFLLFTIANLFPRALDHHKWYLKNFENYPKDRKAIIPFVI